MKKDGKDVVDVLVKIFTDKKAVPNSFTFFSILSEKFFASNLTVEDIALIVKGVESKLKPVPPGYRVVGKMLSSEIFILLLLYVYKEVLKMRKEDDKMEEEIFVLEEAISFLRYLLSLEIRSNHHCFGGEKVILGENWAIAVEEKESLGSGTDNRFLM